MSRTRCHSFNRSSFHIFRSFERKKKGETKMFSPDLGIGHTILVWKCPLIIYLKSWVKSVKRQCLQCYICRHQFHILLLSFYFIILLFVFDSSGFRSVKMNCIFVSRFQPSRKHTYIIIFMSFYQLEKCSTSISTTAHKQEAFLDVRFFPKKKTNKKRRKKIVSLEHGTQTIDAIQCNTATVIPVDARNFYYLFVRLVLFFFGFGWTFNSWWVQNEWNKTRYDVRNTHQYIIMHSNLHSKWT